MTFDMTFDMTTLEYFFVAIIIGVAALYIFFKFVKDDDDWWGMA